MRKALPVVLSLVLLLPCSALAAGKAAVIVTDAGGAGERSAETARRILQTELRANGVEVVDAPTLQGVRPAGDEARAAAAALGATTVYALQLSPLGEKLYVSVQQLDGRLGFVAEQRLQAKNVEELDVVLARLARAIVTGVPAEQTGEIDTVTAREGKKWQKKPGESLWGFGLVAGPGSERPVGGDLRFMYEMERYRLNAYVGWMNDEGEGTLEVVRYCVGASYLFGTGNTSPYVGADLGILAIESDDGEGDGLGVVPHAGVEMFRLHGARLLLEGGVMLPLFNVSRDGGDGTYRPVVFGTIAVVW